MLKKIRLITFLPPFVLLLATIILNFTNEELLITTFNTLNTFFMTNLGWFTSIVALVCFVLLIFAMLLPFGNIRLGGKNAKPNLSTFNWFCISLTTTLASGLLIWASAEPVYHLMDPATALTGIAPMSGEAAKFSMETMYMHWTFIPYAIYTVPTVMFGFMFYNAKRKYSVSSQMAPMLGKFNTPLASKIIDGLLLFCIGVAMAACYGQGLVNMVGCSNSLFGTEVGNFWLFIFTAVITVIAVGSAISGVQKGVKLCAQVNVWGYVIILGAFIILGPTSYYLSLGTEAFGGYIQNFMERVLYTGASVESNWPQSWTTFYWASWMGWAPTTGIFLATIAYGRKIKEVIYMNLIGCASVSVLWMTILSGSAIYTEVNGITNIGEAMATYGIGVAPYLVLDAIMGTKIVTAVYFIVIILTLVTAVNSNVIAMSGLSCHKSQDENGNDITPWYMKVIWGTIVATMAYIAMALMGGYDGIKTLSNIAGIVAVFLITGMCISLAIVLRKYKKYDVVDGEIVEAVVVDDEKEVKIKKMPTPKTTS